MGANDTGDPSGRAWTECGELDKLGHSLQGKLAARLGEQITLLLERIEALLHAGWREVRVVTDHGWLWLPGGLPKVELPKYLTRSRWARCAAVEGGSTVEAPTVPWHWNAHERVAVGPGIACFGAGNEYAHGGLEPSGEPCPGDSDHRRRGRCQDAGGRTSPPSPGSGCGAGYGSMVSGRGSPWICERGSTTRIRVSAAARGQWTTRARRACWSPTTSTRAGRPPSSSWIRTAGSSQDDRRSSEVKIDTGA